MGIAGLIEIPLELRDQLLEQLKADCLFLQRWYIMDYSLIVGVLPTPSQVPLVASAGRCCCTAHCFSGHSSVAMERWCIETRQGEFRLLLGIVDLLQPYTLTKKVARRWKSMFHDKAGLSTRAPRFYAARFQDFIASRFVSSTEYIEYV